MQETTPTLIDSVRSVMPTGMLGILQRGISDAEARRTAERQAMKLLELLNITEPSVDIELLAELPDIEVGVMSDMPVSGSSTWMDGKWHIQINADDSLWRCRATLAHEFKHILDDPFREVLYPDWARSSTEPYGPAERICDYFAGCVLVPTSWLRKAWANGIHDTARLASLFAVSEALIRVRIEQTQIARTGTMYRIRGYPMSAYQRGAGLVRAAHRKISHGQEVGQTTQATKEKTMNTTTYSPPLTTVPVLPPGWPTYSRAKPSPRDIDEDVGQSQPGGELLTVAEACAELRVSKWTLYQFIHSRQLSTVKIRSRRLIPHGAINELVEKLKTEALS